MMYSLRLRGLRDKHNFTQQEIAARLQLTRDAYSLYELGKRQMNYETLGMLADFFDVSIDYLLGRYEANPVLLSEDEQNVVNQYRTLDNRGKETIKANLAFETSRTPKTDSVKKSAV